MARRLSSILKRTDRLRKKRSKKLKAIFRTVLKYEAKNGYRIHFIFDVNSQTVPGKHYRVDIRTSPAYYITEDNWRYAATGNIPFIVNCSCPDFKYRWEAVLHKAGLSRRIQSNGKLPDITNPEYKNSVCKHTLAAWEVTKQYIKKKPLNKIGKVRRGRISK